MEKEKKYLIPKHMDDLPVVIMVELDTFLIFFVGFSLGSILNHPYLISLPALLIAYYYDKQKSKKHKGFIFHLLYKRGLVKPKKVPPYFIKEFGA